jgi:hypothetical protein
LPLLHLRHEPVLSLPLVICAHLTIVPSCHSICQFKMENTCISKVYSQTCQTLQQSATPLMMAFRLRARTRCGYLDLLWAHGLIATFKAHYYSEFLITVLTTFISQRTAQIRISIAFIKCYFTRLVISPRARATTTLPLSGPWLYHRTVHFLHT